MKTRYLSAKTLKAAKKKNAMHEYNKQSIFS